MGGVNYSALLRVYKQAQKRASFGIPLDATILLSVGEVNANKNHEIVIRALAKLKDNNLYYIICGSGVLLEKEKCLAEQLGISQNIIFAGYQKNVFDFYQMADIFVFPSYREGLSVALMEAMASEMPVICSDIRGNNDLIDNGNGGNRVSPGSIELWVEAIKMMLEKRSNWQVYGDYNRKKLLNEFDKNLILYKMREIYNEFSK